MHKKLIILQTHPIQYFAPLYRALAMHGAIEALVVYLTDAGAVRHFDPGFRRELVWDRDLLSGYRSIVLHPGGSIAEKGFFRRRAPGLGEILQRERPDWCYLNGYSALADWQMVGHCRARGIKLLYSADSNARHRRPPLVSVAKQIPVRFFFSRFDHFFFFAEANRDYLLQFGVEPTRMSWSPFAVDVEFFKRAAKEPGTRRPFDFAWIAKLIPRKRVADYIEALERLRARGLRFRAVLGGDGPESDWFLSRAASLIAEGYLEFRGFLTQAQVANTLASAESFVFTSAHEPYGLAVTEAAAAGCAIVATACSGCVGNLGSARPGVNAVIYEAGDVDALTQHMATLLEDSTLRRSLQEGSRSITPEHSLEVAVRCIEAVVLKE